LNRCAKNGWAAGSRCVCGKEKLFFKDLSGMIIDGDTITRIITLPNVLITAHQAFLTREALEQIAATTLQNISDFEKGEINKKKIR
jgi:D-lactate dehydrogenase